MKRSNSFYFIFSMIVAVMFIFASCTKEGPAGPAGKDGVDGEDGIDGTDGTATCIECHDNSQELFAKINQWEHSTHATGGNYERNEGECAICHTSQGFLGNLDGSYDWTAEGAMISDPNPVNCYTCHQIHSTYTVADLAFTVTDPVELRNTGKATFDFGSGNLCASCHQGRTVDPFPAEGGADIEVTSSRYGVHHGPQANTIAGMGLFEPGTGYNNHAHSGVENSCVHCHMAEPFGAQAGGHTWNMAYDYHGATEINTAGCMTTGCHSDAESVISNTEELQAEVQALLDELKGLLDAAGITAEGSDSSISGTYPAEVAGACLNYKAIVEDRSLGVHNPTYIKKVLQNSIAALQ
jgi:nitrate/TMAO reductase-like tetraheme cytochrome c subunit